MRSLVSMAVLISLSGIAPRHAPTPADSPKAVIEQLLQIVTGGGLLTRDGRSKANLLFVHPNPSPSGKPITIIGDDYSLHEIWTRGNHAELFVAYRDLGRIDSSLRYSPPDKRLPKTIVRYDLILIGMPAGAGEGTKEKTGARRWRIENPQRFVWTGSAAAVRYVTEIRDKATDPLIKRNASITLMELKKFRP